MVLTYATIPIFQGEHRRFYREVQLDYIANDHENPTNHPIYVVQEEIRSCLLHLDDQFSGSVQVEKEVVKQHPTQIKDNLQRMYFDGVSSKEGTREVNAMICPIDEIVTLMSIEYIWKVSYSYFIA